MILDLTASRLCYLISKEIESIDPTLFKGAGRIQGATYKEILKLALLNFYKDVSTLDEKDLKLIYEPRELKDINNIVKYRDDLTQPEKQSLIISMQEENI